MSSFPELDDPQPGDSVQRSILLPFVYVPLGWILLIHVGTRLLWFAGYR